MANNYLPIQVKSFLLFCTRVLPSRNPPEVVESVATINCELTCNSNLLNPQVRANFKPSKTPHDEITSSLNMWEETYKKMH
jgi:hypothetical protein